MNPQFEIQEVASSQVVFQYETIRNSIGFI